MRTYGVRDAFRVNVQLVRRRRFRYSQVMGVVFDGQWRGRNQPCDHPNYALRKVDVVFVLVRSKVLLGQRTRTRGKVGSDGLGQFNIGVGTKPCGEHQSTQKNKCHMFTC
jgi:hypothetical protein